MRSQWIVRFHPMHQRKAELKPGSNTLAVAAPGPGADGPAVGFDSRGIGASDPGRAQHAAATV
jgi:hypothetical protein